MQNLLNEEEFLTAKPYNPWKWFLLFYGIAILHISINFLVYIFMPVNTAALLNVSILFIILMPYIMILTKKEHTHLKGTTILFSIIILMVVYAFTYITEEAFFSRNTFIRESVFLPLLLVSLSVSLIYSLISYFIIYLVLKYKRKKVSKTFKAHN